MVDFNLGCDPSVDVEIIDKPSVVFYERVMCFVVAILVIESALQHLLL